MFEANDATNRRMTRFRGTSSTHASLPNTSIASVAEKIYYIARFVSDPISQSGIAANTWTFNFAYNGVSGAAFPVGAATDQDIWFNIYVWRPSNGTKVGTICDSLINSTAFGGTTSGTSPDNWKGTITGSAVAGAAVGDVIIIEVWDKVTQTVASALGQGFYFDGVVNTSVQLGGPWTSFASWLETPENITFSDNWTTGDKLYFHDTTSGLPSGTLPSAEQSAKTVSANNNWEGSQTTNRLMNKTIGTTQASRTFATEASAAARVMYVTRFVSKKLYQTSIPASIWKYNFAARESNTNANFPCSLTNKGVYLCVYVWKPSNGTKYANIFDATTTIGSFGLTANEGTNAQEKSQEVEFIGAAVGSLVSGDAVIVCEIWFDITQATAISNTLDYFYDGTTESAGALTVSNHASYIQIEDNTLEFTIKANISETVSFSDSVARLKTAARSIAESVSLSDSISRRVTRVININESVSFSDSVSVSIISAGVQRNISESVSFGDSVTRVATKFRAINNTITFGDSVTRFKKGIKSISENISISVSVTRVATKFRSISEPSISLGSSVTRFKKAIRAIPNTISFGDSITRVATKPRSISEPSISFSDSISRFKKAIRAINNSVSLSDTVTRVATKFRSISNPITFGDTVTRSKKGIKSISENIIISDSITRIATKFRSISNSISFADSIVKKKIGIRSISEPSISFGDSVTRLRKVLKSINESVSLSDSITKVAMKFRSINNTISFGDSVTRFKKAIRSISNTINFSDSILAIKSGGGFFSRSISETINLTDNVVRRAFKFRSIFESVSISVSVSRIATKLRSMSESISFSDNVTRFKKGIKSISESISLSDTVQRAKSASRAMNESISFSDNVTRFKKAIRNISNTINFTDTVTITVEGFISRAISETINIADNVTRQASKFRSLLENISFTDNVLGGKLRSVIINESVSFNDSISKLKTAVRNILENVTVSSIVNVFRIKINRIDEILNMHPHEIINDYIRDNWLENVESDWYLLPMKDKVYFQNYDDNPRGDFSVWVSNVSSKINREMTDNQYAFYQDMVAIKCVIAYNPEPDHIKMKWHCRSFLEYLLETAELEDDGILNVKIVSVKEDDLSVDSNTYEAQNISRLTIFALCEYTLLKLRT
jgi:hypothetical protein